MNLLSVEVTALAYLVAAVLFILALKGLSSPKSARRGNLLGALGAAIGLATVFLSNELRNVGWILLVIAIGAAISVPASRMVQMTQMPQLVALFAVLLATVNLVGGFVVTDRMLEMFSSKNKKVKEEAK